MPKAIKIILASLIALPVLLLVCIGIFFAVYDANNFKPAIETQAKQTAGINLSIKGELSWSLMPLGININQLEILDQDMQAFASIQQLLAQVELLSIFKGKPKVETILVDGLNLNLVQESETQTNWNNILPESSTTDTPDIANKDKQTETTSTEIESPQSKLDFLVKNLEIKNTKLKFRSIPANQDINLSNINLTLTDIALDKNVPIKFSFDFQDSVNKLNVTSILTSDIQISSDFSQIEINQLQSIYKIKAPTMLPDLKGETLEISFNTQLKVNTKTETINIEQFSTQIAQLTLQGKSLIKNYSKDLKVEGEINIPPFSLKKQLAELGIQLPEMQSKTALDSTAIKTSFSLHQDQFSLASIDIQLDESHWRGTLDFGLKSQAIKANLKGDQLNIDHYLPPVAATNTEDTPPESEQEPAPATTTGDEPLLPLETIRSLDMDITLSQDSLLAHQIESNNIILHVEAKNGSLSLSELSGDLHQGKYNFTAVIDASSDNPDWSAKQSISKLNIGSLLNALPEIKELDSSYSISGQLNAESTQRSQGNTLNLLTNNAVAKADFDFKDGAIEGISLNAYACKGFAYTKGKNINTDDWPLKTPFNTLKGNLALKNQKVETDLDIITTGLHVDSDGSINLAKSLLDIKAGLRAFGELGAELGSAECEVNDKLKGIVIPIKCKGSFDTPPIELCGIHSSRLDKSLAKVAKKEVKRKAEKEVDRALEKHLGKDSEKIKNSVKKATKKALKDLKKWF